MATFLGFGGNAARQRYEDRIFANTIQKNRLLGKQTGLTPDMPYLDPCLPLDIKDEIQQNGQTIYLRGTGDFDLCRETIQPFMNKTNETQTSLNGIYQPQFTSRTVNSMAFPNSTTAPRMCYEWGETTMLLNLLKLQRIIVQQSGPFCGNALTEDCTPLMLTFTGLSISASNRPGCLRCFIGASRFLSTIKA